MPHKHTYDEHGLCFECDKPQPLRRDEMNPTMELTRINDTLELAIGESATKEVSDKAKRALMNGATVTWPNGVKQWRRLNMVIDTKKQGSAMFTWDSHGKNVLHDLVIFTRQKHGAISSEVVKQVWRKFE